MKIRNGFVSNSSSSSFILIIAQDTHKQVLKNMDKNSQEWLNKMFANSFNDNIGDQQVIILEGNYSDGLGNIGALHGDDNYSMWKFMSDVFDNYKEQLPENEFIYVENET